MIDIVTLGTGGPVPTKDRCLSSIVFKFEAETFLLDCGENTQQNIQKYYNHFFIDNIIISHRHLDHFGGLYGYLSTMSLWGRTKKLNIYLPKNFKDFHQNLESNNIKLKYSVNIICYDESTILKFEKFVISFFKREHSILTYGTSIKILEKYKMDPEKLKKIKNKQLISKLQKGIAVIEEDKILYPINFALEYLKEFYIIYSSDGLLMPESFFKEKKIAVLLHEGTYPSREVSLAKEHKHTAISEINKLSKLVNKIFIIHIGPKVLKYKEKLQENVSFSEDGLHIIIDNAGNTIINSKV